MKTQKLAFRLDYFKGVYQYFKAVRPETFARIFYLYDQAKAFEIARNKLDDREFTQINEINFIMAVPINNWETELIKGATPFGSVNHIPLDSRGFFATSADWRRWKEANSETLQREFEKSYKQDSLNILFLYLSEFYIDCNLLKKLRKKNVVIINFNWDDRLHYESEHKGQSVGIRKIAMEADINLSLSGSALSRYQKDGAAVFYWHGCCKKNNVDLWLPKIEFNKVLFFGSCYGYRETVVNYLLKKKIPIEVYGFGWDSRFISYEELEYKVPRYALNLGVSTIGYSRWLSCVKGRDIEVPSMGGLYATNYSEEITNVYKVGKEILTYKTLDDSYRLCCQVLERPEAFADVRKMGKLKAQKYSWDARFEYLITLVSKIIKSIDR